MTSSSILPWFAVSSGDLLCGRALLGVVPVEPTPKALSSERCPDDSRALGASVDDQPSRPDIALNTLPKPMAQVLGARIRYLNCICASLGNPLRESSGIRIASRGFFSLNRQSVTSAFEIRQQVPEVVRQVLIQRFGLVIVLSHHLSHLTGRTGGRRRRFPKGTLPPCDVGLHLTFTCLLLGKSPRQV